MFSRSSLIWFFFSRLLKSAFFTGLIAYLILFFSGIQKPTAYLVLFGILFIVSLFISFRPLLQLLSRLEKYQNNFSHDQKLKLTYQKNLWRHFEEALLSAEKSLNSSSRGLQDEAEKMSTILGSISDLIIAIDSHSTILFANDRFLNEFPRLEGSGITPKLWNHIQDEQISQAFNLALTKGQLVQIPVMEISTQTSPHFFAVHISPLRNAQKEMTGVLGVFYDITEEKKTEKIRVDFVANVSHEMRTPLTSIRGYTQVLLQNKNKMPEDLHPFLEKIISNTGRMMSLFEDLLSLSVIESQQDLIKETIELRPMIESLFTNFETIHSPKKVRLSLELHEKSITANFHLMEQVFSNLIDNAFKYGGENPQVMIRSIKEQEKIIITIEDNGPGISPEHRDRIFERFYRADPSREKSRGTGLGLSIVKHILAKHGGKISLEPSVVGTKFIIELPV